MIGAFAPERAFSRLLPRNQALAVPVAGAAGVVLPGCECASAPVAGSLTRRGVAPAAALAFPGQPEMVLARLVASLNSEPAHRPPHLRPARLHRRAPARLPAHGHLRTFLRPALLVRDGESGRATTGGATRTITATTTNTTSATTRARTTAPASPGSSPSPPSRCGSAVVCGVLWRGPRVVGRRPG
ncbi:permease [Streptomyces sp. NPDC051243]|uniref:permease n=1 Tax=Streptomyces sp. NPDC051243 TaxID=3365646 RepID=UPI00378FB323